MIDLFAKNGHPLIMGVVNVTPDSFSDGGAFLDHDMAIRHGKRLLSEGADILDIGGESTRPDAASITPEIEMARIMPVIEGLQDEKALISIDTSHSETMLKTLYIGVSMINDVQALQGEGALSVLAQSDVPICLMHMQGTPKTMQQDPVYKDIIHDIMRFFEERIAACEAAGISKDRIVIDPGIGFGKTLAHNLLILKEIARFKALECPVMIGLSRKSMIEKICPGTLPQDRLAGSLSGALWAAFQGADILRVHDVAQTKQALDVWLAITRNE
jgi:dihydropteroate synthase